MKTHISCSLVIFLAVFQCCAGEWTTNQWGPTTNSLKMSIMVKCDSETFSIGDINVPLIIDRLQKQSDPVSSFIWLTLSNDDQSVLKTYQRWESASKREQDIILKTINDIVAGPIIYNQSRFKDIVIRGEAKALMQQDPHGPVVARINRILLEDAYPDALSRNMKAGNTTIRISEPLVLTIAFTNMSTNEVFNVTSHRYSFIVITPSGKQISPHGDPMMDRKETGFVLDRERPQGTFRFMLTGIFKFEEIGTYRITAFQLVDWPTGKKEFITVTDDDGTRRQVSMDQFFTVVSNPLTIQIVTDK